MKKNKFLVLVIFVLLIFTFGFTVKISALTESEIRSELLNSTYSDKITRMYINEKGATKFYYQNDTKLNSYGKEIYSILFDFVKNNHYEESLVITNGPLDEYLTQIGIAYQDFVNDHPEFFWLTGGYQSAYKYSENLLGEKTITEISLTPTVSVSYVGAEEMLMDDIDRYIIQVEMLIEESNAYTYNYEKAKFFHDWLVLNNVYSEISEDLSHSAIGALVGEYFPVCEAYAKAFMILCNYADIPTMLATGMAGERHAWNYVEILGEWYFTDVTWDDPITSPLDPSHIEHVYFLSIIDSEHILDDDQIMPSPLATVRFDSDTVGNFYIINFYNANEEIYFSNEVKEGNNSFEPIDIPQKDGYKFIKWDQEFNNVTENMEIRPVFQKANIEVKGVNGEIIIMDYESIDDIINLEIVVPLNYLFIGWSDGSKYYSSESIITDDVEISPIIKKVIFTIKGMNKVDNNHFTIPLFNLEDIEIEVEEGIIVKNIEKPEVNSFTDEYEMEITFGSVFSDSTITETVTITATGMGVINKVINWVKINYLYIVGGVGGLVLLGIVSSVFKRKKQR